MERELFTLPRCADTHVCPDAQALLLRNEPICSPELLHKKHTNATVAGIAMDNPGADRQVQALKIVHHVLVFVREA